MTSHEDERLDGHRRSGELPSTYDSLQSALDSLEAASFPAANARQSDSQQPFAIDVSAHAKVSPCRESNVSQESLGLLPAAQPVKRKRQTRTRDALGSFSTEWRAQPRQSEMGADSLDSISSSRRALIGGPTLEQMKTLAQNRATRNVPHHRPRQDDVAAESVSLPQKVGCGDEQRELTLYSSTSEARLQLPIRVSSSDVPGSSATTGAASKQTLSWAQRRDRRDARRRSSPPLTRRRAAQKQIQTTQMIDAAPSKSRKTSTYTMPTTSSGGNCTAEVTDPSFGEVDSGVPSSDEMLNVRRIGKRKAASRPMLDLTLTEPAFVMQPQPFSIATQASSVTQSESDGESSEIAPSLPIPIDRESAAFNRREESDTEDEDDAISPIGLAHTIQALSPPAPAAPLPRKRNDPVNQSSKRKESFRRKRNAVTDEVAHDAQPLRREPVRAREAKGKSVPRARPLFDGMTFALAGFWSKVKMYEKLITKHAGTIIPARTHASFGGAADDVFAAQVGTVTHFVFCPHASFIPDAEQIRQAVNAWSGGREDAMTTLQRRSCRFVQSRWISDCIELCLRKEDLLSVDKYRLSLASTMTST